MDFSQLAPLLDHIKANVLIYAAIAAVLIPLIIFARRYSVAIILYAFEISIYLGIMHLVLNRLVAVTAWFKESSSMTGENVDWATPMLAFWDKAEYHPEWLLYVELCFAAAIILLVWRLRPMKVQKKRTSKFFGPEAQERKKAVPGYRDYSDLFDDDLPPAPGKGRGGHSGRR